MLAYALEGQAADSLVRNADVRGEPGRERKTLQQLQGKRVDRADRCAVERTQRPAPSLQRLG